MSDQSPKNAGICPAPKAEVSKMSAAFEARELVASIAGPSVIGGKIKEALFRVAYVTGLSERRVRGIWNRESKSIRAEELDALRRIAKKTTDRREANARAEFQEITARLAFLEERLAQIDANRHRPHPDAQRETTRRMGGDRRSMAGSGERP